MPAYSILVGVDQTYHDNWAITLLESIQFHSPWIKLRCHVVNPNKLEKLPFVEYTTEYREFANEDSKIAYLQAVRFLEVAKLPITESVVTLDADSICCKYFSENEFKELFKSQFVAYKIKTQRFLAGFIAFGNNNFRQRYAEILNEEQIDNWKWGRDQKVFAKLREEFTFVQLDTKWLSIGKNGLGSKFLTLKGGQKETNKYLAIYEAYKNDISPK